MLAFRLADRWGEPDPRKILSLPAGLVMMWLAFLNMQDDDAPVMVSDGIESDDTDAACAAFIRVMK